MSTDPRKPHFRFFPKAYKDDSVFVQTEEFCEICGQPAGWMYAGITYTAGAKKNTCASCLSSGRLAESCGDHGMSLHDCELAEVSPDLEREVLQRTPGFSTFNAFDWPVSQGLPLAYVGHGEDLAFAENPPAREVIRRAGMEIGQSDWDYPAPYVLIFQELRSGEYTAILDLD